MEIIRWVLQVVVALGILNVWLLRFSKATPFRGGNAQNLPEEFAIYGLPYWFMMLIGACKLTCAVLLLVGIFYPPITPYAGLGMATLMAGAVSMHFKVGDPIKKAFPAIMMLLMSLSIISIWWLG